MTVGRRTVVERFTKLFRPNCLTGCWEWTGDVRGRGYGYMPVYVGVRRYKKVLAHRMSYEQTIGAIPNGLLVCHTCDNILCVNPDHLFVGTPLDNARDMCRKGRQPRGVSHGCAKLDEIKVAEIRSMFSTGMLIKDIAVIYGVGPSCISAICSRDSWAHIA